MTKTAKIIEFTTRVRAELAQLANDNDPRDAAGAIRAMADAVLGGDRAPSPIAWDGDRYLTEAELRAVRALIRCQADGFGVFDRVITLAVEIAFDIDELAELRAAQFDAVMAYLVHLPGADALPPMQPGLYEQGRQP